MTNAIHRVRKRLRKACSTEKCEKSAQGATGRCVEHGGGKRCSTEKCEKGARGATGRCVQHGGGKRCSTEKCEKVAQGATGRCIEHGGGNRCQGPNCPPGLVGNSVHKTGDLCSNCRPENPLKKRIKKKEEVVAAFLTTLDIQFHRENRVTFCVVEDDKHWASVDFVIWRSNYVVILSVDEHQHSETKNCFGYTVSCELARMSRSVGAIIQAQTERGAEPSAIKWIRYNPDGYLIDNVRGTTSRDIRHAALLQEINNCPATHLEVKYLFYNMRGNAPEIFSHVDFNDTWKVAYCG